MSVNMLFVIGSPRSGTTMLERMLSAHSKILGGPEPHLLTPLAHLGVWDRVEKAPYDPQAAAEGITALVDTLPDKDDDYWAACRAYCDVIYGQYLADSDKEICLDKTPAYGLVLPFIAKVFPDAKYVVLTRHPLAAFSSFANSFFDGNYQIAQDYNPLLDRYVPALAHFIRQDEVSVYHIRYEDLVEDPDKWMREICQYVSVPFEESMVDYRERHATTPKEGLGDPIGVKKYSRPSTASVNKWVNELAHDSRKRALMESIIDGLDGRDLETLGYPIESLWAPLTEQTTTAPPPKKGPLTRYRLERKFIVHGRTWVKRSSLLRRCLSTVRAASAALLRD